MIHICIDELQPTVNYDTYMIISLDELERKKPFIEERAVTTKCQLTRRATVTVVTTIRTITISDV